MGTVMMMMGFLSHLNRKQKRMVINFKSNQWVSASNFLFLQIDIAKAAAEWQAKKESGSLDSEKNEEENIYVSHQFKVSYISSM